MPGLNRACVFNLARAKRPVAESWRGLNAVWLNPAHVERDEDEDESENGQYDADRQHFYGSIGIFLILDHAEHARSKAEND